MKKLYEKKEVLFAVLWIVAYCALTIPVRGNLGDESPWMLAALAALAVAATFFIKGNALESKYGLTGWAEAPRKYLYFLPMFFLATGNLWSGFGLEYQGLSEVLAVLSMLLVGYVEEVLFRGFLFKALLKKDGPKPAILISAITFGIGHIVNLLAGQASLETAAQVVFAIAWGMIFTVAFYKSGSLWPCIVAHGLVNAFSKLNGENPIAEWVYIGATIVVALVYCPYLLKLETAENNRQAA
ncbi:MAG: CPBP family intramembrane metalloprotease [Clostridia bacterium]|nr:CPBP family intramembrane metalloprotease [Clostridia bacterium]